MNVVEIGRILHAEEKAHIAVAIFAARLPEVDFQYEAAYLQLIQHGNVER